ncbi:MAG TPA: TetR/AcrR family transcriptional regulator [Anaerolineae bacterium]|jgi:AcrR family transcriptional regulator
MGTQLRAIATRDHILDSAEDAFARSGYDATGVAEVCAAAGVSKGAFYHHFATKQALFLALLNRWLAVLDKALESIRASAANPVDAIEQMAALLQPFFGQGQTQSVIVFEFWSQARREPAIWKAAIEPYRRYRSFIADIIRAGISSGAFKPVEPELSAQTLVSLVVGLLLQGMMDPDGADWGMVLRDSVHQYLADLVTGAEVLPQPIPAPVTRPLVEPVGAETVESPDEQKKEPKGESKKKKKKKSKHKH